MGWFRALIAGSAAKGQPPAREAVRFGAGSGAEGDLFNMALVVGLVVLISTEEFPGQGGGRQVAKAHVGSRTTPIVYEHGALQTWNSAPTQPTVEGNLWPFFGAVQTARPSTSR